MTRQRNKERKDWYSTNGISQARTNTTTVWNQ